MTTLEKYLKNVPEYRQCKQCGWLLPLETYETKVCPVCREPFTDGVCSMCKEYSPSLVNKTGLCMECVKLKGKEWKVASTSAVHTKLDLQFEYWAKLLRLAPDKILTEEEWQATCNYFNGCAMCNSEVISTRQFFVSYKDGGRYTKWNVIPLCDKCALSVSRKTNPVTKYKLGNYEKESIEQARIRSYKVSLIKDYLFKELDKAVREKRVKYIEF